METRHLILTKQAILTNHEFFRDLSPAIMQRLVSHARVVSYPSGRSIFHKGDDGHGLLAVLSGVVKISAPSDDGKEIVLNLIGPNEVFGEIALLDGQPRTADATALTACELVFLDRRDFLPILTAEPAVAIKLLEIVSRRLRRTSKQVEDITFVDVTARLAKALLQLAAAQDATGPQPRIQITQKELGATIGLSRESTNRHLREWEEKGYIALEKGACVIKNRDRLLRLAGETLE